jgi:hypothetical protein
MTATTSALFNMLRNLGGTISIAAAQGFVTNGEKHHSETMMKKYQPTELRNTAAPFAVAAFFAVHNSKDPQQPRCRAALKPQTTQLDQCHITATK